MRTNYILVLLALVFSCALQAQIVQVSNINQAGNSDIKNPFVYNSEIYFEADAGDDVSDELYKIASDGTVSLVKNINVDPDDSSPSSDPGNFIEYNGLLYFNANDGDKTGHDKELWSTDGTEANTQLVADINPELEKGSNPQQMFVFNGNLYFQANDGSSTQFWKYTGTGDPVKITNLNGGGYATPMNPIVDETNNWVWFQANNGKNELHILKADETIVEIDINETNHGYTGSQAIMYNGKLIFQGDDGTHGDELWISDGTLEGTSMLLDIYNVNDEDGNPEGFVEFNGKIYFVAETETGTQLWETDGTTEGTKLTAEPNAGGVAEISDLYVYNNKLYFAATDGSAGIELWVYDGTSAMMLKDLNTEDGIGSEPEGFKEVGGLMFFSANDVLHVTDGTAENTISAASFYEISEDPVAVNSDNFVVIGSELFFTGDDAEGDDFFKIDVNTLFAYTVTFNVTDGIDALEGAEVTFNGETKNTDASGTVVFEMVKSGTGLAYTITKLAYIGISGTIDVTNEDITKNVTMTIAPTYKVTFDVASVSTSIEGALIVFNQVSVTTDVDGLAVFENVPVGVDMPYEVIKDAYQSAVGTVTVVDQDVTEVVELYLITYTVTFNVTDGNNALEDAEVTFNGSSVNTNNEGVAMFTEVVPVTGLTYVITKEGYIDAEGTIDVEGDETENVQMLIDAISVKEASQVVIYPNPSLNKISIQGIDDNVGYKIYDSNQRLVESGIISSNSSINHNYISGLYFIHLQVSDGVIVKKVIVQ